MTTTRPTKPFISEAEGCRRLCVGRKAFHAAVKRGLIGVLRIPGLPDRYNVADVDALLRDGVQPATASREPAEAGMVLS